MFYYQELFLMRYSSVISSVNGVDAFIQNYYSIFTEPMDLIKKNLFEFLIGTGVLNATDYKFSIILSSLKYLEMGILAVSIKHGGALVGITLVFLFIHILKLLRYCRKSICSKIDKYIIFRTLCITLPLFVSLIHYTTLFKPGIVQLVAASIALGYAVRKKKVEKTRSMKIQL